jgi:hypothetical protein
MSIRNSISSCLEFFQDYSSYGCNILIYVFCLRDPPDTWQLDGNTSIFQLLNAAGDLVESLG